MPADARRSTLRALMADPRYLVGIDLGTTNSAEAIAAALQRVAAATAAGEIEPDVADKLAGLLAAGGDARALLALEARIAALESALASS